MRRRGLEKNWKNKGKKRKRKKENPPNPYNPSNPSPILGLQVACFFMSRKGLERIGKTKEKGESSKL